MPSVLRLFLALLPWQLRRPLLCRIFGYEIHPTARVGWAWIAVDRLIMGPGSQIGHFTVCKGLAKLELGAYATIGRANWITAFPADGMRHFQQEPNRRPVLQLGDHAAITNRHLIDCTSEVEIGAFSTLGGFRSQLLTHSIDLSAGRQASTSVRIGKYCFIGTGCILLGGSVLPDCSVLGAGSVLRGSMIEPGTLYAGVPARAVRKLDMDGRYFLRTVGFVERKSCTRGHS